MCTLFFFQMLPSFCDNSLEFRIIVKGCKIGILNYRLWFFVAKFNRTLQETDGLIAIPQKGTVTGLIINNNWITLSAFSD